MKEKENYIAAAWLDTAVKKIRCGSDRRRVRRELKAHLDDAASSYSNGMAQDSYDAYSMAVKNMGDAEEIAAELAKIHKPYLAQAVRIAVFLALFSVITLGQTEQLDINGKNYKVKSEKANMECYFDASDGRLVYEMSSKTEVSEYKLWIDRAVMIPYNAKNSCLLIELNIKTDRFDYLKPKFFHYITVEDEFGNVFKADVDRENNGLYFATNYGYITNHSKIAVYFDVKNEEARHYTVKYDRAGVSFALPVDLVNVMEG